MLCMTETVSPTPAAFQSSGNGRSIDRGLRLNDGAERYTHFVRRSLTYYLSGPGWHVCRSARVR
jgi:hypothetical protein